MNPTEKVYWNEPPWVALENHTKLLAWSLFCVYQQLRTSPVKSSQSMVVLHATATMIAFIMKRNHDPCLLTIENIYACQWFNLIDVIVRFSS